MRAASSRSLRIRQSSRRTLSGATAVAKSDAQAPVAQLDRALPSEGKGHRFESCRVRHPPE